MTDSILGRPRRHTAKNQVSEVTRKVRIFIVDDHPLIRRVIPSFLESEPDLEVCGTAGEPVEAKAGVAREDPDLVLLDLSLSSGDGLTLLRSLHAQGSPIRTIILSMFKESIYAEHCLRLGASGYVNKRDAAEELIPAIRTVLRGDVYVSDHLLQHLLTNLNPNADHPPIDCLSIRELEVIRLLAEGHSIRDVADRLHINLKTAESHRDKIKRKLNVADNDLLAERARSWLPEASSFSVEEARTGP
jgi:DNA-binding NarL/FixJ family response regulator